MWTRLVSNFRPQVICLPRPSKVLGVQAWAPMPGLWTGFLVVTSLQRKFWSLHKSKMLWRQNPGIWKPLALWCCLWKPASTHPSLHQGGETDPVCGPRWHGPRHGGAGVLCALILCGHGISTSAGVTEVIFTIMFHVKSFGALENAACLWSQLLRRLRWEDCLSPGGQACSELSHHCTSTWATEQHPVKNKTNKQKKQWR